jgi:serine/threonine protein kinase
MAYELVFPKWPVVPDELKEILIRLLEKDPDIRMTAMEIVANEWLLEQHEEWETLRELIGGED